MNGLFQSSGTHVDRLTRHGLGTNELVKFGEVGPKGLTPGPEEERLGSWHKRVVSESARCWPRRSGLAHPGG